MIRLPKFETLLANLPRSFDPPLSRTHILIQARSQEFAMGGGEGLVWMLEITSNDLDPDFDRSSLRLSRFFCPNLDDLPLPKKNLEKVFLYKCTSGP